MNPEVENSQKKNEKKVKKSAVQILKIKMKQKKSI